MKKEYLNPEITVRIISKADVLTISGYSRMESVKNQDYVIFYK